MRQTGQTNLNLDMVNLLSYPPCKKLFGQLQKYPQEVIPTMDQILKDLVLEIADEDQQAAAEGMEGSSATKKLLISWAKYTKCDPLDSSLSTCANSIQVVSQSLGFICVIILAHLCRYQQAQGSRHLCHSHHPRHESGLFPVSYLLP